MKKLLMLLLLMQCASIYGMKKETTYHSKEKGCKRERYGKAGHDLAKCNRGVFVIEKEGLRERDWTQIFDCMRDMHKKVCFELSDYREAETKKVKNQRTGKTEDKTMYKSIGVYRLEYLHEKKLRKNKKHKELLRRAIKGSLEDFGFRVQTPQNRFLELGSLIAAAGDTDQSQQTKEEASASSSHSSSSERDSSDYSSDSENFW